MNDNEQNKQPLFSNFFSFTRLFCFFGLSAFSIYLFFPFLLAFIRVHSRFNRALLLETIIYLCDVARVQDKHDLMRFDAGGCPGNPGYNSAASAAAPTRGD